MENMQNSDLASTSEPLTCVEIYESLIAKWEHEDAEIKNQRTKNCGHKYKQKQERPKYINHNYEQNDFPPDNTNFITFQVINNSILFEKYKNLQSVRQKKIAGGAIKPKTQCNELKKNEKYVPGKRYVVHLKQSSLTYAQMNTIFDHFRKYGVILESFKSVILHENAEFQSYVAEMWRKGNFKRAITIDENVRCFIDKYWQDKICEAKSIYPSVYRQINTIPLTLDLEEAKLINLKFVSSLHTEGSYHQISNRMYFKRDHQLTTDDVELQSWVQFQSRTNNFAHKNSQVSEDKLGESLLIKTNSNIIMTSSSVKTILNNTTKNHFGNSWMIPIRVKLIKDPNSGIEKKCIFVNKKLTHTEITQRQKLKWFCKIGVKKFCYDFVKDKKSDTEETLNHDYQPTTSSAQPNYQPTFSSALPNYQPTTSSALPNYQPTISSALPNYQPTISSAQQYDNIATSYEPMDDDIGTSNDIRTIDETLGIRDNSKPKNDHKFYDSATDIDSDADTGLMIDHQFSEIDDFNETVNTKFNETINKNQIEPSQQFDQIGSSHQYDKHINKNNNEIKATNPNQINNPIKHQYNNEHIDNIEENLQEMLQIGTNNKVNKQIKSDKINDSNKKEINNKVRRDYSMKSKDGLNRNYSLWCLFKEYQRGEALLKTTNKQVLNLIIRSKTDGQVKNSKVEKQCPYLCIKPKVEYQCEYGVEIMTLNEILDEWISLYIRPNAELLRVRVAHDNLETIMTETLSFSDIQQRVHQLYNLNARHLISNLYSVLCNLVELPIGTYLLTHDPKSGAFANLYVDDPRGFIFPLAGWEAQEGTIRIQSLSIDTTVLAPMHYHTRSIPALFPPSQALKALAVVRKNKKQRDYYSTIYKIRKSEEEKKKLLRKQRRKKREKERKKLKNQNSRKIIELSD